jgi:hypothetical protein
MPAAAVRVVEVRSRMAAYSTESRRTRGAGNPPTN